MNKDAILATIIGFVIGLCLTVLLIFGPNFLNSIKTSTLFTFPKLSVPKFNINNPVKEAGKVQGENNTAGVITIKSPQNESIVDNEEIVISGSAVKNKIIIVSTPVGEYIIQSNSDGEFLGKIKLKLGLNQIFLVFLNENKYIQESITVYYTNDKL